MAVVKKGSDNCPALFIVFERRYTEGNLNEVALFEKTALV